MEPAQSQNNGSRILLPVAMLSHVQQMGSIASRRNRQKKQQTCRFYASMNGCRAGDSCPFLHDNSAAATPTSAGGTSTPVLNDQPGFDASQEIPPPMPQKTIAEGTSTSRPIPQVDSGRVVQRPTPHTQAQDPRKFQITQIKTRFNTREETTANRSTILHVKMTPSDPDFPFEIDALECSISVPPEFPCEKPSMKVTNKVMERGYQINVERGFDAIWAQLAKPTLLIAMKTLDRDLEAVLIAKKADTVKIVTNTRPQPMLQDVMKFGRMPEPPKALIPVVASTQVSKSMPSPVSAHRRKEAESRRDLETGLLEHRLGRHPRYSKGGDGTIYTLPLEPRKHNNLPSALEVVKAVHLFVPKNYDIETCTVELLGVDSVAAASVEKAFARRAAEHSDVSILAQINFLAQNMHVMAAETIDKTPAQATSKKPEAVNVSQQTAKPAAHVDMEENNSHIKIIPRPLEWAAKSATGDEEDTSSDDSDYTTSEDEEDECDEDHKTQAIADTTEGSSTPRERGILISFPHMELYSTELLELTSPSMTVKCERCKDTMDIPRLRNNDKADYTGMRSESCRKCALPFAIGYRKDLMHANSIRAGYLDLDGCTVVDLLPSAFTPTCSECSTPYPSPGITAVRGDCAMAICRECHHKMSFKIPEVKFLFISSVSSHAAAAAGLPRKKPKDNLGIVAGQELPRKGRCQHYGKSYRWFRFACCQKVFPCDKCHDDASEHPNEFANRMICGMCSREQNYRPEDCGMCHSPLTGKTGSGFWEGGKGTRDKSKMSRKDPRKYKRRAGTAPRTASKTK